ncbi:MAG: class II aldolase/adducin family protein, partial [Hyphomicrobiales bacterium]
MTTSAIPSLWDDRLAETLDEAGLLLYRSNLLGSDLRITNFGGGNTSAKIRMNDPLTDEPVTVLWVKGSGGDLGSMKLDGFATLYLDKLESLKPRYRGIAHEDEMVEYLPYCTSNLNPRAASIDTPLHAFVPWRHVDHVHPDAVIAIAASRDAEALTREIYGGEIGFLPWQRPGFDLGLKLGEMAKADPQYAGVVLGGHGLFTWAESAKECYLTTLRIINKAADWLAARQKRPPLGGERVPALDRDHRRHTAIGLMPEIRGRICTGLAWAGLTMDTGQNDQTVGREGRISADGSKLHAWVIPTNEELLIA